MITVTSAMVPPLAAGAAFLGSGGGGQVHGTIPILQRALAQRPVRLLPVDAIENHWTLCSVAQIGAPLITVERLTANEIVTCAVTIQQHLGRPIDALVPLEIGGQNALAALLAASRLDIPLIDGDTMGRAFPGIHQTSLTLGGISAIPVVASSSSGTTLTLETAASNAQAERVIRRSLAALGGSASTLLYGSDGASYRRNILAGSVTRALRLGDWLLHADRRLASPAEEPLRPEPTIIFRGVVLDLVHRGDAGTLTATTSAEDKGGPVLRIDSSTEFERALVDGRLVAEYPDIITITDARDPASALAFEDLIPGAPIAVYTLPSPPLWKTPEGRRLADREEYS